MKNKNKKLAFPKKTTRVFLRDLGFEEDTYEDFYFDFWKDPSRSVVFDLLESVVQSVDELKGLSHADQVDTSERFFAAVSRAVMDTNIDGLSFDTEEKTRKSFAHPDLPWGFMYTVVTSYVLRLLETQQALKKTLVESAKTLNSGNDNEQKESEPQQKT